MNKRLKAAIYGLAIGDALGVPVEFETRGTYEVKTMIGHGTHDQQAGTWSDDTSMTLATCASIKNMGKVDVEDMRKKFCEWAFEAKYTVDNIVFDMGITTHYALKSGKGEADEYSNGNGSLMRIIPLAFTEADDKLISEVSAITHAHQISKDACCEYVSIARKLLEGKDLKEILAECSGRLPELCALEEDEIKSSGFVIDTLEAALWAIVTTDNFKDALLKAVNLGRDTDTVGAVTGGLAGIIYGYEGIPAEWIETLRGKDMIEECLF